MKTYASLTDAERDEIVRRFEAYKEVARGSADPLHGAACVAHDMVCGGDNGLWNGKAGSNAYSIVLTVLAHKGAVKVAL